MPHPEDELDATPEKRPSHFRKRRSDSTTRLVRTTPANRSLAEGRGNSVDPASGKPSSARDDQTSAWRWRLPPPPPLPSFPQDRDSLPPVEDHEAARLKRIEDRVATIGLAVLVAIMLAIVWKRMTSG